MTEADVREMVSVICALEMDSDTISAILFLMKMIMMSASRDLSPRNGEESLRDLFSERPETNIFISQTPWTSRITQTWRSPHDLVFGTKKDETEQTLRKKYAQLTRCKFLCPHRSWRSEATRRNREITGFDHRNFVDLSSDLSRTLTRSNLFTFFVPLA